MNPAGNDHYEFVKIGNLLGDRVVLLCMVIVSVAAGRFYIEQPGASNYPERPRFQWMLSVVKVFSKPDTTWARIASVLLKLVLQKPYMAL
jgi:hypothetical protein